MAAITSSNYRNPAIDKIQSGYNPSGYSPALPPYIDSVSGSVTQGSTMTITAVNASSETSATLQFTDFESLTVGQKVVGNVPFLEGNSDAFDYSYTASSDRPLTGARVAKANAVQTNIGLLHYATGGVDELFVEFYARVVTPDFTSSPDAPQIKFTRLASDIEAHGTPPYIGITIQGTQTEATLVHDYTGDPLVGYVQNYAPDVWERHTLFMRLSDPAVANGMRFYRTSFGNNWGFGGNNVFATPDEWGEPETVTRGSGDTATRQLEQMFFPFFQRGQQTSMIDINHIYIHSNLERVYMSTSPTATASTSFKHVVCPTVSRSLTSIQFKSMIDVFEPEDDVYLYIVNANNRINTSGYLVRAGA